METPKVSEGSPVVCRAAIARRYGVTARTISAWQSNGLLPFIKINARVIRFPLVECDAAIYRLKRSGVALVEGGQGA